MPPHGLKFQSGPPETPGSTSGLVTFAITNPTSVLHKASDLANLNADCLVLSETSATSGVQAIASGEFRAVGYKTIWGNPVPQQLHAGNPDSLRGAAIGVSIHAKLPIRSSRQNLDSEWYTAGRFMHAFVRLPHLEVQVCNLYGLPASVATAKGKTNSLLHFAHQCIRQTSFPAMICGDLNHHPDTLDEMRSFKSEGYCTIQELFHNIYGDELPPTFGDSTRHDVCILSPPLASLVRNIWVDQQHIAAGHNPLCFQLQMPTVELMKTNWTLPQPWIPLDPKPHLIHSHYSPMFNSAGELMLGDTHKSVHPLQSWAVKVESAVHAALMTESQQSPCTQPWQGLPRKFRGRCQPRKIKQIPFPRSIRTGWKDHYTPDIDQPNMQLRQHTCQMRRIQSLKQRLHKAERIVPTPIVQQQLQQEWNRILDAPGFRKGFRVWMMNFPELLPVPIDFPSHEYVFQLEQLFRFQLDQLTYDQKTRNAQHVKYMQELDDKRFGRADAFKRVKEPSPGLVGIILKNHAATAEVESNPQYGLVTLRLQEPMDFDYTQPVFVDDHAATIVQSDGQQVELMLHDEIHHLNPQVTIQQQRETSQPSEVADQLTLYWRTFWNRDSPEQQHDLGCWTEFESLKQQLPRAQEITVALNDLQDWKLALAQIPSTTARGCCGWAPDELKALPDSCIRDLIQEMNHDSTCGFPPWLMKARVVAVAKHHKANTASATRPITVLSLLYRLWSKMVTRQILKVWTQRMPASISGFLPGRSAHGLIYEMQLQLEATNHSYSDSHWGGLTLDIIKCFNTLPQPPLVSILIHLGVPRPLVLAWMSSIQKVIRYWHIDQQLHEIPPATTGVPEGDAMSVVAMLGINAFMVSLLEPLTQKIHAFADNWSYSTSNTSHHRPTIQKIVQITRSLSLGIDWGKTWACGTHSDHRDALKAAKDQCLDPAVQLRLVTHARDLGYIMHYRLSPYRGTQKERHRQAIARMTRLKKADLSIATKAYIAMSAGITKAMYGTHMYLVGETYLHNCDPKSQRPW